jgi:Nif-specific regulatory protein
LLGKLDVNLICFLRFCCRIDSGGGQALVRYEGEAAMSADFHRKKSRRGVGGSQQVGLPDRASLERRVRHLEAVLEMAQGWYETPETGTLLEEMARSATRLLEAERASVFLWDREAGLLVARPALGVEGGELRIADDTGVVGRVVHSASPRRLAERDAKTDVGRDVARELKYPVRTLLCVPLVTRSGQVVGAFEVLNKRRGDFSDEDQQQLIELAGHAAVALENSRQLERLLATQRQLIDEAAEETKLMGESPPIVALRATVANVARTDLAVLVLGENGTGKEVVSRMIHLLGRRRDRPFLAVNCAALAESLLESELFGHELGAFTDARQARPGKFELATGGTLLLDEIGEMSLAGQAKLLRVIEEKQVVRVGGSRPIYTDVRIVAATNQDLADMVARRRFREDLFYRLNVVTLPLPPLRQRGNDVILLAEHFLDQFSRDAHRKRPRLTLAAKKTLLRHNWPGNVRELRNVIERLAYLHMNDAIEADDLEPILLSGSDRRLRLDPELKLAEATRRFQRGHIEQAIERHAGNMSRVAQQLGLHRSNLYRKMRQLGITVNHDPSRTGRPRLGKHEARQNPVSDAVQDVSQNPSSKPD